MDADKQSNSIRHENHTHRAPALPLWTLVHGAAHSTGGLIGPLTVCSLLLLSVMASPAATVIKTNNTINLNLATSWVGGQAPGSADMAKWEATVTGANAVSMGADLSWLGVVIANPGGAVTISSGNTLTLGTGGIDMSAATQNATNLIGLTLLAGAQVWNVQSGRTLALGSNILGFTRTAGATVSVAGAGTVAAMMKGLTNDLSLPTPGILGPWATIGANSQTNYATLSSGMIMAYTGVSSPFNWPATSLGTNWDVTALSSAISLSHSANTVRYTGAAGSQTNGTSSADVTLTLNGLMNAGLGALTLVKGGTGAGTGLVIGTNRELVLNAATAPIIINMPVFDNAAGTSALTVAGTNGVTLSATNTFSGVTSIAGGALTLGSPAALQNSILNYDNLGGTLSFATNTSATLAGLTGAQNLGLTNAFSAAVTLTVTNTASMTYSGVLFGSGGLVKQGTGTLTLVRTNTYTGPTAINNGTLLATNSLASASVLVAGGRFALSGAGSVACTNLEVASGATFDVSGLSSTFTLSGGQSLVGRGTVTGSVATASLGASIYPGKSGLVGTLTCTNTLNLSAGGAAYFDLSGVFNSGNDKIVVGQNLSLARTNSIHLNALTGGGILATNGDYVLFAVSGTTTMASTPLLVWDGTLPANYDHYSLLKSGNNVVLHYNSSRVVPMTLEVANLNDTGSGSLRQALQDASDLAGDTIAFDPGVTGKIVLTNGGLLVAKPITISGPGAQLLVISGNSAHRVFHFTNSTAFTNPTIISVSGLTICDGRLLGTNGAVGKNGEDVKGAGILNEATLTLAGCVISNNIATAGQGGPTNQFGDSGNGGNASGGGIESSGPLAMSQCSVVSNAATGGLPGPTADGGQGYGGGIYCEGSDVPTILTACTISGNKANAGPGDVPGFGAGGGIYTYNALQLTNCTVANNAAIGGGIDEGGGIDSYAPGLILRSCTLSGNQADYGGGLRNFNGDLGNTIVAGNSASFGPDCDGPIVSSDYNLIQNTNGCTFTGTTTHNIIGQTPLLGALQDNGGPTPTMALLAGSPAIDKGNSSGLTSDQRGGVRPFEKSVANASGGDGSDIGAFEVGSYFLLTSLQLAGNDVRVSFTTDAGNSYALERIDDLSSGSWTNVMTNIVGTGSIITATNFGAGGLPRGFYRGQALP